MGVSFGGFFDGFFELKRKIRFFEFALKIDSTDFVDSVDLYPKI